MLTRRNLFSILAGAIAAPIVVRSGLTMPVKALVVPDTSFTLDDLLIQYISPAMAARAEQIAQDLFSFGTGTVRVTESGITRVDPSGMRFDVEYGA